MLLEYPRHHSKMDPKDDDVIITSARQLPLPPPPSSGSINPDLTVYQDDEDLHPQPGDEQSQANKAIFKNATQKLTFISMCLAYLTSMMSFSIIAPFFPLEVS